MREEKGPLRKAAASGLLMSTVSQATAAMGRGLSGEDVRALHASQVVVAERLVRAVQAHRLEISLTGAFRTEIERALAADRRPGRGPGILAAARSSNG